MLASVDVQSCSQIVGHGMHKASTESLVMIVEESITYHSTRYRPRSLRGTILWNTDEMTQLCRSTEDNSQPMVMQSRPPGSAHKKVPVKNVTKNLNIHSTTKIEDTGALER